MTHTYDLLINNEKSSQAKWLQFRLSSLMLIPLLLGLLVVWSDQVFDHFLQLMIGYGAIFGAIWSVGRIRLLERSTAGAGRALRIACTGFCGGAVAGSLAGPVAFLLALERNAAGWIKDLLLSQTVLVLYWEVGTAILVGAWIGTVFAAAGGMISSLLTIYLPIIAHESKPVEHAAEIAVGPQDQRASGRKSVLLTHFLPASYLLLLAGLPAWVGFEAYRAYRERQAEAQLQSNGGVAVSFSRFIGPDWSRRYSAMMGNERQGGFFWRAESIYFHVQPAAGRRDWHLLHEFVGPENFSIIGKEMTDDELLRLVQQLESMDQKQLLLDVVGTSITDAGLKHLTRLPQLTRLRLYETPITDEGMKHLAEVPNLEYLDVAQTGVTLAGVTLLKNKRPAMTIASPAFALAPAPLPATLIIDDPCTP